MRSKLLVARSQVCGNTFAVQSSTWPWGARPRAMLTANLSANSPPKPDNQGLCGRRLACSRELGESSARVSRQCCSALVGRGEFCEHIHRVSRLTLTQMIRTELPAGRGCRHPRPATPFGPSTSRRWSGGAPERARCRLARPAHASRPRRIRVEHTCTSTCAISSMRF